MAETGATTRTGMDLRWGWWGALSCFLLAGLTGFAFRLGMTYGFSAGLQLVNLRHAHSHLMYFGWVTPALVALIGAWLPAATGRPRPSGTPQILGLLFATALLAYPLFLAFGYTPATLGAKRLPLSVIAAGLNIVGWYLFVGFYARATRGVPRNRTLLLWDIALTFLVFATLGAWGLSLLKLLGLEAPFWPEALKHLFLDIFSEGWFVLALLGLVYAVLDPPQRRAAHWSLWLIVAGLPVTFAFGMPASLVPTGLAHLARVGGTMVAVGLLANVRILWQAVPAGHRWTWRIPLALLALKAVTQLGFSLTPGVWWSSEHGLRILYLHLTLLGFVSLGLVAVAGRTWGRPVARGAAGVYAAVLILLASLLPLTSLWPSAWTGLWSLEVAAWAALAPVVAVAALLGASLIRKR